MERRNSRRLSIHDLFVEEKNGDYLYTLKTENLSEEGVFLIGKFVTKNQDYVSYLKFRLPNQDYPLSISALMVRERGIKQGQGVAYHFVSMDEPTRMSLKRYLVEQEIA